MKTIKKIAHKVSFICEFCFIFTLRQFHAFPAQVEGVGFDVVNGISLLKDKIGRGEHDEQKESALHTMAPMITRTSTWSNTEPPFGSKPANDLTKSDSSTAGAGPGDNSEPMEHLRHKVGPLGSKYWW